MQTAYFRTEPFTMEETTGDFPGAVEGQQQPNWWDRFLDKLGAWLSRSNCTDEEDYWAALMLLQ
jgi:hypothetical protein